MEDLNVDYPKQGTIKSYENSPVYKKGAKNLLNPVKTALRQNLLKCEKEIGKFLKQKITESNSYQTPSLDFSPNIFLQCYAPYHLKGTHNCTDINTEFIIYIYGSA